MKIQYFVRGSKEGQNSVDENDDVTLQGIETMQKLEYVTMLHAKATVYCRLKSLYQGSKQCRN